MGKTLVFGASTNPARYSNIAIHRLVDNAIETEAFGIRLGNVSGVHIQNSLQDFQDIDTVSLYLNPKRQEQYYQAIVDINPRRVVFNPGTENPEFQKLLQENGIEVEVACTLVLLATGQF